VTGVSEGAEAARGAEERREKVGERMWSVGEGVVEESEAVMEESGASATARMGAGVRVPTISRDWGASESSDASSKGRTAMSPERVMTHRVRVSAITVNATTCRASSSPIAAHVTCANGRCMKRVSTSS
jgi:hypothetical protein